MAFLNTFGVRVCCLLIRAYQLCISPILPQSCRFYPTCSAYALEAFRKHGICGGFVLSVRRIVRCHPYNRGGFDPVPEELFWKKIQ